MRFPVLTVWGGLALAAAAVWQQSPLWALVPAVAAIWYGLLLDDDPGGEQ